MKQLFIITVSLLCICIIGCGNVQISGRVTFSDTGEPLSTGTVCFVKGTEQGSGKIDSNGYYKVDFGNKRGIPKGEYKIYIEAFHAEPETAGTHVNLETGKEEAEILIKRTSIIAAKYENIETSDLSLKVDGKTKTFDIKIDRP
jgi:hypothetical protein